SCLLPGEQLACAVRWRDGYALRTTLDRLLLTDPGSGQTVELQAATGPVQSPNTFQWLRTDGRRLLWGTWNDSTVHDWIDGRRHDYPMPGGVGDGRIAADGAAAAFGAQDQVVFFDLTAGRTTARAQVPELLFQIELSQAGTVYAAGRDGWVGRVDPRGNVVGLTRLGVPLLRMALAPDERTLAIACGDGKVRILESTGELRLRLPLDDMPWPLSFSPDGSALLASTLEGLIHVWPIRLE